MLTILKLSGPELLPAGKFITFLKAVNKNSDLKNEFLVMAYFDAAAEFGIPAGPLLAQNFLETANYTSVLSRPPFNNMAGIGASSSKTPRPGDTLDPADKMWKTAISYLSVGLGIRAHFSHIKLYMTHYIDAQIGYFDAARAQITLAELQRRKASKIVAIDGLSGLWAGPDYAAKIYKKYSEIAGV